LLVQMQVGEELLTSPEIAASSEPPSPESTPDARKLYDAYCAVCHGRNGKGRGEARTFLTATAPDLTLLKYRNGGTFPRASVEQCIRAPERRHSTAADSDMPVWTALSFDHNPGAAAYAGSIAEYVESLQRRSQ
jgi:mono/diheme cytochrome c family protein